MAAPRPVEMPVRLKFEVPIVGVIEHESVRSDFNDVGDFNRRFGLPAFPEHDVPHLLDHETQEYRVAFLREELKEFTDAWATGDLPGAFDALLDLVYVAEGTAHFMGLPWQEGWDEVQRANMTKERASSAEAAKAVSGRSSSLDVIKPEGWTPPDIEGVLARYGA